MRQITGAPRGTCCCAWTENSRRGWLMGERFTLKAGMSYHVGDGEPRHRSFTKGGARLFIVD